MIVSMSLQVDRSWYPQERKQQQAALVAAAAAASRSGLPSIRMNSSGGYDSSSSGGPGYSGTSAASMGLRHALRLDGGEVWSPFSYAALQKVSGALGATHSAVLPIKGIGRGLALEVGYVGKPKPLVAALRCVVPLCGQGGNTLC
jgi:hypothetical protein